MMVELIASLSVIQTAGAPPLVLAAPAVGEAPAVPSSPICSGHVGRDVAKDPMLVEVIALLPVIKTVEGNGGSASTVEDSNIGGVLSVREELKAMVCLPLQMALIRGSPRLRRSKMPMSTRTLRHSGHIAAKPRAANTTRQAQNVLMKKLEIDVDEDVVDLEIERKFRATFQGPMSANKQQALQILFNGDFDPAAMDLDMAELDTVEA
jgi:hypothetical protein